MSTTTLHQCDVVSRSTAVALGRRAIRRAEEWRFEAECTSRWRNRRANAPAIVRSSRIPSDARASHAQSRDVTNERPNSLLVRKRRINLIARRESIMKKEMRV